MVAEVDVSLIGAREVEVVFKELGVEIGSKVARESILAGAKVLEKEVKANFARLDDPLTREDIEQNVVTRYNRRFSRASGNPVYDVGVRGGAKQTEGEGDKGLPGGDTWYWRLLEFGTERTQEKRPIRNAAIVASQGVYEEFSKQMRAKTLRRATATAKRVAARSSFQQSRRRFFGLDD